MNKHIRYYIQIFLTSGLIFFLLYGVNIGKAAEDIQDKVSTTPYESLVKKNLELRSNLDAANTKMMALEEERNAFIMHIRMLQKEKEALKETVKDDGASVFVTQLKEQVNKISEKLKEVTSSRDSLAKDLEQAKVKVGEVDKDTLVSFQQKDAEVQSLIKENSSLQLKIEKLERELETLPAKLVGQSESLKGRLKAQKETSIKENASLKEEIAALKKNSLSLKGMSGKYEKLKGENERLKKEIGIMQKDIIELKKKIDENKESPRAKKDDKKIKKELARLHYNLAVSFDEGQKYQDAEKEYLEVLKLDPFDMGAVYNLAIVYDDKLNKNKLALRYYKKFLELRPIGEDANRVKLWIFACEQEHRIGAEMK